MPDFARTATEAVTNSAIYIRAFRRCGHTSLQVTKVCYIVTYRALTIQRPVWLIGAAEVCDGAPAAADPNAQELDISLISPKGQTSYEVKRDKPNLDLMRIM